MLACVAVVALLLVGAAFAAQQERLARGAAEAANFTPAPLATPADIIYVTVIGDSYTGGSGEGGNGANNWTALLQESFADAPKPVRVNANGIGGSGYVALGQQSKPFPVNAAETVRASSDVVVIVGSSNDRAEDPAQVSEAAAETYATVAEIAPDATLIVVGPPFTSEAVPEEILRIRDAVKSAATEAGAVFVDPIADSWFFGEDSALIGSDGVHPTDAGHAYMAELIRPAVAEAVEEHSAE